MIALIHADGKLPNLALMRLGTWLRSRGEKVKLVRHAREWLPMMDGWPTGAYGSSIFSFTRSARTRFEDSFEGIVWGGTGVRVDSSLSEVSPDAEACAPDYTLYPDFDASIGFLTRGCRLRCGFCVVPKKEGKPRVAASVRELWRGEPWPRHLHLLDNDAFAPQLADHWRDAVREIREGGFRVCFSQGINLRLVNDEAAAAIASIRFTGQDFARKRLYTAWDNIGDEAIFRRGVAALGRAGIPASYLTVYVLVGYDPQETWETALYRITELIRMGAEPYPMVYDRSRVDLLALQRWAVRHLYRSIPFPEYGAHGHEDTRLTAEARAAAASAWERVAKGWKPPARRLEVMAP